MVIDALIPTKKIIFLHSSPGPGARVRVVPHLDRDRRGLNALISF
jgi:hypothetical protein